MSDPVHRLRDGCAAVTLAGVGLAVVGGLLWILIDLAVRGFGALSFEFLVAAPTDAGRGGGIGPILVSTLLLLLICMAIAVPCALGTAVLLSEFARGHERLIPWVRRSLDLLASVPSIVFGLFGNAVFCQALGMGYSILSGGLTLACMVLPLVIRTTEDALRRVPLEYRHGGVALGLSRTTLLRRIVLPAAAPGLAAGLVLGVGRALAETAALVFTSGYVTRTPGSLLDSGRALSVHVYDLAMNVPGGNSRAYASALVLVTLVLAANSLTWLAVHRFAARGSA